MLVEFALKTLVTLMNFFWNIQHDAIATLTAALLKKHRLLCAMSIVIDGLLGH